MTAAPAGRPAESPAEGLSHEEALYDVREARRLLDEATVHYRATLKYARHLGCTLDQIGRAAGITRQGAWKATAPGAPT